MACPIGLDEPQGDPGSGRGVGRNPVEPVDGPVELLRPRWRVCTHCPVVVGPCREKEVSGIAELCVRIGHDPTLVTAGGGVSGCDMPDSGASTRAPKQGPGGV